jgi:hypothetical protein
VSDVNTYRVWMKDGYARIVNAESEDEARGVARELTELDIKGAAMTKSEKRRAVTVDKVEQLNG